MDVWLDMSDGICSAYTHSEAELSTIPTHLMSVCYPTFPSRLSHLWHCIFTLHTPS